MRISIVKLYDNKTALLKSVLKTVMDPPPLVALRLLYTYASKIAV